MTIQLPKTSNLYELDYVEWLAATSEHLRSREFKSLDIENLIEEIEALGRSEKREIETFLF